MKQIRRHTVGLLASPSSIVAGAFLVLVWTVVWVFQARPLNALTAPVSGAVSKTSGFVIWLPWAPDRSATVRSGYGPSGGSSLHDGTNRPLAVNDYYALDFDVGDGQPVHAIAAGRVIYAGWATEGWGSYGRIVFIDHGNDYQSLYAHLKGLNKNTGDPVARGDEIGTQGASGYGTDNFWDSHLHFALYYKAQFQNLSAGIGPYGGQAAVPEPSTWGRS